jgi:hypothetical protein
MDKNYSVVKGFNRNKKMCQPREPTPKTRTVNVKTFLCSVNLSYDLIRARLRINSQYDIEFLVCGRQESYGQLATE